MEVDVEDAYKRKASDNVNLCGPEPEITESGI